MDVQSTWYLFPLAIVISLIYSASRYELPSKILSRAGRMFLTIMIFMGIVFVVLDFVLSYDGVIWMRSASS